MRLARSDLFAEIDNLTKCEIHLDVIGLLVTPLFSYPFADFHCYEIDKQDRKQKQT